MTTILSLVLKAVNKTDNVNLILCHSQFGLFHVYLSVIIGIKFWEEGWMLLASYLF
jgi:hypothetical protein